MDPAFWHARWAERRIGFHEGRPNQYLVRHAARLADHHRVFVPMCGKSEDLAFLASRGHEIVGVELVELAVREFFDEHQLHPAVTPRGSLVAYAAPPITIYAGDVFAATRDVVGPIDAIYDRAALVAMPPDLRRRYVDHLRSLGARRILLVSLELAQPEDVGPPFSVIEAEVRALYDGLRVDVVDEGPDPRTADGKERCFVIEAR